MKPFQIRKKLVFLWVLSAFLLSLGMAVVIPSAMAQQPYVPSDVVFAVNPDGVSHVEYTLAIDNSFPRVEVPLFGDSYENLLVLSGDGSALDFSLSENILTIDSLGATTAVISYNTPDLTSKSGSLWTMSAVSPVDATIRMPECATIVSVNKVPIEITNADDSVTLKMPLGEQEITYVLTFAEARERALAMLNQARTSADQAQKEGRINGLDKAQSLLSQAQSSFNVANYAEAEKLALQASTLAKNAQAPGSVTKQQEPSQEAGQLLVTLPLVVMIILALVTALAVGVFLAFRKRRTSTKSSQ